MLDKLFTTDVFNSSLIVELSLPLVKKSADKWITGLLYYMLPNCVKKFREIYVKQNCRGLFRRGEPVHQFLIKVKELL